ncbi:MAG TPA: SDR family NAD(P)-dependent oxidoreductase [Pseudomonadales bacterium]|nr:SDR family NAD(P)-dependent oxidoreductase [Pseudomonadales bacterium]
MNPLLQVANGVLFFTGFVPSFSAAGHRLRALTRTPLSADFRGQRWLVTGASTGLGRALSLAAAGAGAEVLAVARSADALRALADAAGPLPGRIDVHRADLSTIAAVDALADAALAGGRGPDVLVNNVGVLFDRPDTTVEGLDRGFATNLLGPWRLTERLRAADALGAGACVITMSSGGLYNVPLSVRALERQRPYDGTLAYAFHKRAQLAVNHAWRRDARGAEYYVMHPGWARTPGVETALPTFNRILGPLLRTPEEGIDTALWLAARRPSQARPEGLWFDRRLRPEHLLFGSRGGADEADLIAALEAAVERAAASA